MDGISEFVNAFYDCFDRSVLRDEDGLQMPSKTDLKQVCQVLLSVSCMREEGRYPSFRVCFIDPESPFLDVYVYSHILRFQEPLRFFSGGLHKLAPALNGNMSYLMLDLKKKPFQITGILASYTAWEKIMTREVSSGNRMPKIPNIIVKEPGKLEACFGETPVVSYNTGSCITFRTDTFTDTLVAEQLRNGSNIAEEDRLSLLYRIVWNAKNYGHGGLICIVPSAEACESYFDIKYRLPSGFLFRNEKKTRKLSSKMHEKEISVYADLIAKFTSVDGAVVLTKDFDLLGFGAEAIVDMSNRNPPTMCFIGQNNREDRTKHFYDNGMRHRACYRLCDAVEGSVAIIISQDGFIKACTKSDGKVIVYDQVALPLF